MAKKLVTFCSARILDPSSILMEYNVILLIQSLIFFHLLQRWIFYKENKRAEQEHPLGLDYSYQDPIEP